MVTALSSTPSFSKAQKDNILARNIIIYDELKKVLAALNSAGPVRDFTSGRESQNAANGTGIKVIVLAGAALAKTVYPDIRLRPMTDIDLLVHQKDLPRIEPALFQADYLFEVQREHEAHYHNTNSYFTIHIDTHFQLPYLDEKGLKETWARAVKTNLAGIETLILSPEDTLIYVVMDALIYHAQLGQVCLNDIELILRHAGQGFDWTCLTRQTKRYHLEAPLYYALSKVETDIPEWVFKAIKPRGKGIWELRFYQALLNNRASINDDLAPILRFIIRPGRVKYSLGSFLPSSNFMAQRYGLTSSKLSYLYYPIRVLSHFWRVIKVGGQILWNIGLKA